MANCFLCPYFSIWISSSILQECAAIPQRRDDLWGLGNFPTSIFRLGATQTLLATRNSSRFSKPLACHFVTQPRQFLNLIFRYCIIQQNGDPLLFIHVVSPEVSGLAQ